MYDPDSIEDETPILRSVVSYTRNAARQERYERKTNQLLTVPELVDHNDITHECFKCRATLSARVVTAAKQFSPVEFKCYACNDYRLFVPLTYSTTHRWAAVALYKLRNAWRVVKHKSSSAWQTIKRDIKEVWQ